MVTLYSIAIVTVCTILNIPGKDEKSKNIVASLAYHPEVSVALESGQIIDTTLPKQILLRNSKKIEALSIHKRITDTIGVDYRRYKVWGLSGKQIESIVREFDPMPSEEQYLSYSFYGCEINGEMNIDGKRYKYWIGAGATLTLEDGKTFWYYGCEGEKCKQYFISWKLTKKELEQ